MDEDTWQAKIIGMQWIYNNCELRPSLFDVREKHVFQPLSENRQKVFPDECNQVEQGNTQ